VLFLQLWPFFASQALLLARLRIAKVELLSDVIHIPPDLAHLPLADVGFAGIKLLATPF
jgi:hypothetical protein